MTLVTSAQGINFIVASADSRGTFGEPSVAFSSYDVMEKLAKVTDHVVISIFGASEIGDNIFEEFKQTVTPQDDGISNVLLKFQLLSDEVAATVYEHPLPIQASCGLSDSWT
jgi:ATP-dependent protease HslVU (ClpYQ) peptidase subunit